MKSFKFLLIGLAVASSAHAATPGGGLTGTYEAITTDCAPFLFYAGETGIRVEARSDEFVVKDDVLPATVVYDFQIGNQRVYCLGDCYSLYETHYADGGKQLVDNRLFAGTVGAQQLVQAGTTTFTLTGDTLVIDSNDNGQGQPGPSESCTLKKTH